MLSLLVVASMMSGTSEAAQREGLNMVFRCGVYHMGMAFVEVLAVPSVFEMGPLLHTELGWFVHVDFFLVLNPQTLNASSYDIFRECKPLD
jgi:hypothetical protein